MRRRFGLDEPEFKNASFPNQLAKTNPGSSSNKVVISQPSGFIKPNDVSNKGFNPVIHKIRTFMVRKEEIRNSGKSTGGALKVSFLNVRNLWTNPTAAQ